MGVGREAGAERNAHAENSQGWQAFGCLSSLLKLPAGYSLCAVFAAPVLACAPHFQIGLVLLTVKVDFLFSAPTLPPLTHLLIHPPTHLPFHVERPFVQPVSLREVLLQVVPTSMMRRVCVGVCVRVLCVLCVCVLCVCVCVCV